METSGKKRKNFTEKKGKIPASGGRSETYKEKEDVNPQDIMGSSTKDPSDPEKPRDQKTFDTYPLEEPDTGEGEEENEGINGFENDEEERDIEPSGTEEDEFLK